MPQKIVTSDGDEIEVPTKEEIDALTAKAAEADVYKKKVDDIENDPVQKNWKQLREKDKRMEEALKAKGLNIKEDGSIEEIKQAPTFTLEDVDRRASSAAMKVALDVKKNELLSKYKEEDRKVVDYFFNKLTQGEDMDLQKVEKFVNEASLHITGVSKTPSPSFNGQPPRFTGDDFNKKSDFAETDLGKQLANEAFGDESFTKVKK